MSATTGLPRFPSWETMRVRSYSRKVSRSGENTLMVDAAGGRVGRGEAEEQLLPAGALERLDAVCDRAVLILGERPRIDDLEDDVPVGSGDIGVEQGAHPRREGRELRRLLGQRAGHGTGGSAAAP